MISHKRWSQIKVGDYIWFGIHWRKVIETRPFNKPTFSLEFIKVNNNGRCKTTVYYYADIYKKIKAICKIKINS